MNKLLDFLNTRFAAPQLTRSRMLLAVAVAVVADLLQIMLVPLHWAFVQQIVDVIAMALTMLLIGFHPLLLPTFLVEFIPLVGVLPTWTGCVIAVVALRKRGQKNVPPVQTKVAEKTIRPDIEV